MATRVDDFAVGRWYAITREPDVQEEFSPFFPRRYSTNVNGRPLKLLAMSLPFAVFTDGRETLSLDTRQFEFIRLDYKYVKAIGIRTERRNGNRIITLENPNRKSKKKESREGCCPMCGCRLRQKFRNQGEGWLLTCPECGFEGGLPKDGGRA